MRNSQTSVNKITGGKMFVPPKYPTHLTSQMENVHFINTRTNAKKSIDLEKVAWYIGLTGDPILKEQFAATARRVEALLEGGWSMRANYSRMEDFIATHPDVGNRIDENPARFTSAGFFVDGGRRYFLLEAPVRS